MIRKRLGMVWLTVSLLASCAPPSTPTSTAPATPSIIPAPTTTPASTTTPLPTSRPAPTALPSTGPSPRAGHELVYHDGLKMILLVNTGWEGHEPGVPAKVWGWNGDEWTIVSADGPEGRDLGGVAYDSRRDKLIVYGGRSPTKCYSDTWEWDGQMWQMLAVVGPNVCDHLAMVYDAARGKVVLFGGQDRNIVLHGDTWEWDGQAWTMVSEEAASTPPPRAHYALAYDSTRQKVLLFGGFDGRGDLADLWEWDGTSWHALEPGSSSPLPRAGARLAFDPGQGRAVLFGGSRRNSMYDDTWIWDGTTWTEVSGQGPSGRGYHAMAYDPIRRQVVLFGGQSGIGPSAKLLGDTWVWDGEQWRCVTDCE